MDWDQIENKWAAMTRRVRADWTGETRGDAAQSMRNAANGATLPATVVDRQSGLGDVRRILTTE